ncbi:hypothetical protein ATO49_03225 [Mycolicibacterium fortuitum subsp. fortuitum DSM 46621 = ATCC 6841 = JCM 6387]|nr:hypothetical protein ATO49_03225 [Mycolicibacterium fortuitum subsp. fortuitum DSM 46621 = ATCC 6841 = JCM 6387]
MERVARTSIVDVVIARLRDEIRNGNWPVGTKIPTEATLVDVLGVSRPSVREAVRSLVQAGLLESRQGDGTYVVAEDERRWRCSGSSMPRIEPKRSWCVIRWKYSPLVKLRLTARRPMWTRCAWPSRAAGPRKPSDLDAFIDHDVAFHIGVARASHNVLLLDFYRSFEGAMRDPAHGAFCMSAPEDPHRDFHNDLFHAIQRGDHGAATRAAIYGLDVHERHLHAVGS